LTKKIVEPKNQFQFFSKIFFENLPSSYDRQKVLGKNSNVALRTRQNKQEIRNFKRVLKYKSFFFENSVFGWKMNTDLGFSANFRRFLTGLPVMGNRLQSEVLR